MQGHLLKAFEAWVVDDHGIDTWHAAKEKAGCDVNDNTFITRQSYQFRTLIGLVDAVSGLQHCTTEEVLKDYGKHTITYLYSSGYETILRSQGSTLRQCLSNLNAMHDHIPKSLCEVDESSQPVFWCEDALEEDSIILHYYSHHGPFFVPMVVGMVEELASHHFEVAIIMEQIAVQDKAGSEKTSWKLSAVDERHRWKLTGRLSNEELAPQNPINLVARSPFSDKQITGQLLEEAMTPCPPSAKVSTTPVPTTKRRSSVSSDQKQAVVTSEIVLPKYSDERGDFNGLSMDLLKQVFPFHVVVDHDFKIQQVGVNLPQVLESEAEKVMGMHIQDIFKITRPVTGFTWEWRSMNNLFDQNFFMSPILAGVGGTRKGQEVEFKTAMLTLSKHKVMFSLCPDVKSIQHLNDMGLTLSDLSLVTSQRDAVFLGEYIAQEAVKTNSLDKLSKDLKSEQKLSTTLLYNMLPRKVADDLRMGKTVEPEFHENVTLFLSDIEGFTNICQQVRPWEVIDMVNQLYSVMDSLVDRFDLYKVETVGDSYMCCSGVPEPDDNHAEKIANFALAVIECSRHIKSPATGEPIRLRIGIHTGSCTSGVVGNLTPHYCLFGDMVNFTSRHESTGAPDKIHCSSDLFGRLKYISSSASQQFNFKARGLVDMKGKGEHYTYWLESATESNQFANPRALQELSEEARQLITSEKWKMRRYFQDDSFSDASSVGKSIDNFGDFSDTRTSFSAFAGDNSRMCSIGGIERPVQDDSHDDGAIIGFSDELLSERATEWQEVSVGVSSTDEDVQRRVFEALFEALTECVDKSAKRLQVIESQLRTFVQDIAAQYSSNRPFYNFRSAAEILLRADFLWEHHSNYERHDPWDRFILLFSALVHNLDHTGVPNSQLEAEGHPLVDQYKMRGAYQQRSSMDSALEMIEDDYEELYEEVFFGCPTFRKSVKSLMMLDADMESDNNIPTLLSNLGHVISQSAGDGRQSRKRSEACSGIVFVLAAAGYYCQSYDKFLRWNGLHFQEELEAFRSGRSTDPRPEWHNTQALIFDEIIVPIVDLVETIIPKVAYLKQCALSNKNLWALNGKESLAAMLLPSAKVETEPELDQDESELLISQNVSMLEGLLKEISADQSPSSPIVHTRDSNDVAVTTPYAEIQLAIEMEPVDAEKPVSLRRMQRSMDLPPAVRSELRDFVISIASGYQDNAFHNFQHACHVAHLSNLLIHSMDGDKEDAAGIVNDPFVRFAIVLSAMVHDVGHTGVPNSRLAKENKDLADKYNNKSLAEQNSVDVAWEILTSSSFANLQHLIFGNSMVKRQRLRQLLVNCVMATDIFDEDLRALRQQRWEHGASSVNCMATMVMEHVLQASDVGHTMQSWELYREWNERLFNETYTAFRDGRAEKDPSESWYQRELWFFDNWVLPLTHSLKRSGVLNIISEQLLEQANQNKLRWEREGQEVCEAMLLAAKKRPMQTTSFNTLSNNSYRSESLTAAGSSLTSTMLGEIESLSKVMQRYERKMETACGKLVALTAKRDRDTRNILPAKKSMSSSQKHFRQQDSYNQCEQQFILGEEDSFGEISALSAVSNQGNLQEMLDKAEVIAELTIKR
eukprot:scaffold6315_cov116-Cylindrotheca_fusiformis.AAC.9